MQRRQGHVIHWKVKVQGRKNAEIVFFRRQLRIRTDLLQVLLFCKVRHAAWTIVIHYCTVFLIRYDVCSQFKNAAACLVTGTQRCDHITPVVRQLHWLPVRQRIHFKIAGCVIQALTAQAALDDCHLISDSDCRRLRSSDIRACVTPRTSTRFGDRSFSAAGPQVWNGLPSALRAPDLTFNSSSRSDNF